MSLVLTTWTPHAFVMAADSRFVFLRASRVDDHSRKIIPWPTMRAAVGFAGVAMLSNGIRIDEVLEALMFSQNWASLQAFANAVARKLDTIVPRSAHTLDWAIKVHIAGMEEVGGGGYLPAFYYVRNTNWTVLYPPFRVTEDLRTTVLTPAGGFDSAAWASRWSGEHVAYAARAQRSLAVAKSRLGDVDGVANWARAEIRSGARALARLFTARSAAARRRSGGKPNDGVPRVLTIGGRPKVVVIYPGAVRVM